jgi:hypothetical protein
MVIETRCRITGVTNPIHLVASHSKPWACKNEERINGANGLLLIPNIAICLTAVLSARGCSQVLPELL